MQSPASNTPQPLSSAEYLAQLRAKRQTSSPPKPEPKTHTKDKKETLFPGVPKPRPKKTILAWTAPSRPYKKRDRKYYTTVVLIVVLISLILFFAGQFLPIAVVISMGFLAYVLSSVPPHNIKIELSTYGISVEDRLYYWEEMGRFWFDEKFQQQMLLIEIVRFPGRIALLFEAEQKNELRKLFSQVLLEEKPAETFYDRAAKWLQEKIPLELDS